METLESQLSSSKTPLNRRRVVSMAGAMEVQVSLVDVDLILKD